MNLTYEQATAKAGSLKDIGEMDVYLFDGPYPWHLVTSCEPGGSHRLEISTDVRFYAYDPKTGLSFRWSFELEPRAANGNRFYRIDVDGIYEVLSRLQGSAKGQFQEYLAYCAVKVREKGIEWQKIADQQFSTAEALEVALREP